MNELSKLLRSSGDTKAENRQAVLRSVMAKPGSQRDLVRRTGRSKAMISSAVQELRASNVFLPRRGGREDVVRMGPTHGVVVGVELGFQHTYIVARRVDQDYDQAMSAVLETGAEAAVWPATVAARIRDLVGLVGDGAEELTTVGLAIPRMVDPRTQELTPPLLPPWENQPAPGDLLAQKLGELTGQEVQVAVDNDANLGALGESVYGGYDRETLLYIKVSTGVGAGIMIGGIVVRGRLGIAGEFGHMVVDPQGRFCACGGRGCLETIVGADRLVEQAGVVTGTGVSGHSQNLEDLIRRADRGDLVCRRVLTEAAGHLGRALGSVCNLLSPDVIVIGGTWGTAPAAAIVLPACSAGLNQTAMPATHGDDFQLCPTRVNYAGAHGALIMGIQGARSE
ncbi:ROK family protein [Actinospica durhamensis]|uniref:ROK family protein n=1 Tax=Actinospica durhamensis TaxID=1508375 RepID=A0A941ESC4_9ACTN|nr:ROK family protein [Actinospica durhamensis]MBR7832954.1 ROK family protein [Actinospica durhamensis]